MSGIARKFLDLWLQLVQSVQYYAGLWSRTLIHDLQWNSIGLDCPADGLDYVAPSWSPFCRIGPVTLLPVLERANFLQFAQYRQYSLNTFSPDDAFARVKSGFLRLVGPLWKTEIPKYRALYDNQCLNFDRKVELDSLVYLFPLASYGLREGSPEDEMRLIPIRGLMLQRSALKGEYVRVGTFNAIETQSGLQELLSGLNAEPELHERIGNLCRRSKPRITSWKGGNSWPFVTEDEELTNYVAAAIFINRKQYGKYLRPTNWVPLPINESDYEEILPPPHSTGVREHQEAYMRYIVKIL